VCNDGSRKICIDEKLYIIKPDIEATANSNPKDTQDSDHSTKNISTSPKENKEKDQNIVRDSSTYYANSDDDSVPGNRSKTSPRKHACGGHDADDPRLNTEEESASGSESISSYDSEGHRKRKVKAN
jgi:hypothetical protein